MTDTKKLFASIAAHETARIRSSHGWSSLEDRASDLHDASKKLHWCKQWSIFLPGCAIETARERFKEAVLSYDEALEAYKLLNLATNETYFTCMELRAGFDRSHIDSPESEP